MGDTEICDDSPSLEFRLFILSVVVTDFGNLEVKFHDLPRPEFLSSPSVNFTPAMSKSCVGPPKKSTQSMACYRGSRFELCNLSRASLSLKSFKAGLACKVDGERRK